MDWCWQEVTDPDAVQQTLAGLIALHQAKWESLDKAGGFHAPSIVAFHQAVARRFLALGWLRLLRLDGMSLWIDEVFTWDLVAPGRGLRFGEQILAAYQGPLYHAAVWPLLRVADTAFMLRLPAARWAPPVRPATGRCTFHKPSPGTRRFHAHRQFDTSRPVRR